MGMLLCVREGVGWAGRKRKFFWLAWSAYTHLGEVIICAFDTHGVLGADATPTTTKICRGVPSPVCKNLISFEFMKHRSPRNVPPCLDLDLGVEFHVVAAASYCNS